MASPPATIEQLARETAQIDDPETALRALTALRRELDATEPEIVRRALQARASWSQIARALGISKQAAHRKYRHLFEQADIAGDQRMLVSDEARQCIEFAREEAKRLGQPAVATEHILLGILRCDGSEAAAALNAEGVTLETARDCLQTTMPGLPPPEANRPAAEYTVSSHARRIVDSSRREAREQGEDAIGVEHLLLALLSDSRNGAVQTLEEHKTTSERIRRRFERPSTSEPPAPLPPDLPTVEVQVTSRSRPVSTS